ncbi:MAG: uracil-DNA glycosylase family protein [Alphaproteobacteria bacterium]
MADVETLDDVARRARACRLCPLPHEPRPVLRVSATARLLIVGQAPGTRVHETGIPWNDPSGDRLREWLEMDRDAFYDQARIAIMPMGFCFPGQDAKGGDLPPRRECAPAWHAPLRALMPDIRLTLLVGSYAQARYLDARRKASMTDTVRAFADYLPDRMLPLPHPSWRNTAWLKRNPWFAAETLPALRRAVADLSR